ncbi:MAG: hypothetical protein LPK20_05395 [Halomonas sp.]|jgi:uncharacterized membrane protein|uniref:DUF4870 domain-containing protein n=1 Tax=Billgrantia tianxiuensis TaxID=2497861 RepID=A0A6I6SDN0_9GAMM|nr:MULTISPECIES: hypothetical protein [Halomonas]MCE8034974.1 hypothetical protein [Halomonas sp. MCCC 1A11057]MDX5432984.1 hypothetical protein [Halomonas sp.]QHC48509.1 hypothetical protein EKK97_01335 [Halomonas tianxiuensis]
MSTVSYSNTQPDALDTRGRGLAAIVYVLYLGSVMAVITAPIGVLIAHWRRRHAADWVASHLQFQIRTFWLGALGGAAALGAWNLLGLIGAPAWASWVLGYGFFTACLAWTMGRCGVGIHRLLHDRAIDAPRSLLFGGARVSLEG